MRTLEKMAREAVMYNQWHSVKITGVPGVCELWAKTGRDSKEKTSIPLDEIDGSNPVELATLEEALKEVLENFGVIG